MSLYIYTYFKIQLQKLHDLKTKKGSNLSLFLASKKRKKKRKHVAYYVCHGSSERKFFGSRWCILHHRGEKIPGGVFIEHQASATPRPRSLELPSLPATTLFLPVRLSFPLFRRHWPRERNGTDNGRARGEANGEGVWVALVLDSKILARPAGATSDFFIGRRRRRRRRRRERSVLALFFQPLTPPSARSPLFRFSSPSNRVSLFPRHRRQTTSGFLAPPPRRLLGALYSWDSCSHLCFLPRFLLSCITFFRDRMSRCRGRKYKCGGLLGL